MSENTLAKDLTNFIGGRLEGHSIYPGLAKANNAATDMIKNISHILADVGNTDYGDTEISIIGELEDIVMRACCRNEENGYLKGFMDGLQLIKSS